MLKNQDLIEYNELNSESNGGTELTTRSIFDRLDRDELDGIQIITSRVRNLDPEKIRILHLHDLPLDPESTHLKNENSRNSFHKLVFSSQWQYQQFRGHLSIPYDTRSAVILTGIDPIPLDEKPKDKIRMIYTATPHRGLEILVPVFIELTKSNPDIELDVFSSFGIYGSKWEGRDEQYKQIFKMCEEHPQINYHGWKSNDVVREAYQKAHIFPYPCIWEETSCRSLIEAMSAGCICVHPNLAALPETSGGLTLMYDGSTDIKDHTSIFAASLQYTIDNVRKNNLSNLREFIKLYADSRHSWDNVIIRWKSLIQSLKMEYTDDIS